MPGEPTAYPGAYRPRPLPRPVRPFPGETLGSYLHRLARANHIPEASLSWALRRDGRPLPQALAAATGRAAADLVAALPDLRPDNGATVPTRRSSVRPGANQRAACQICAAGHQAANRIRVWTTHEDLCCAHHRRWLGMDCASSYQFDLTNCPDHLPAQQCHRELIRMNGRERVRLLHQEACEVVSGWHHRGVRPARSRAALVALSQAHPKVIEPMLLQAAWYPTVVALIPVMLATPPPDSRKDTEAMEDVYANIADHVTDGYHPRGIKDPFICWLSEPPWPNKQPETFA